MRNIINIFELGSKKPSAIFSDDQKAEIKRIVLEAIAEQMKTGGVLRK